jgi:hypothetical protein
MSLKPDIHQTSYVPKSFFGASTLLLTVCGQQVHFVRASVRFGNVTCKECRRIVGAMTVLEKSRLFLRLFQPGSHVPPGLVRDVYESLGLHEVSS